MRDATKKNERITELEKKIEDAQKLEAELKESIESQNKEITTAEAEREKWKKIAEDTKALGVVAPGSKAGQERAVATAREMEALKTEIANLQAAVRYLREDNRRARLGDSQGLEWLEAPLTNPIPRRSNGKALFFTEGQDVLTNFSILQAPRKHTISARCQRTDLRGDQLRRHPNTSLRSREKTTRRGVAGRNLWSRRAGSWKTRCEPRHGEESEGQFCCKGSAAAAGFGGQR